MLKEKIKLIFLDIDGVLNCDETFMKIRKGYDDDREAYLKKLKDKKFREDSDIDKKLIGELNKIIRATHAKIVVSSSWRIGRTVEELKILLKRNGCIGEVIDKTARSADGVRGYEIHDWLEEHSNYEIESFVILDDDADMEHLYPFLIRHNYRFGLTPTLRNIAIRRLNDTKMKCPIERGLYPNTIAMKTYTAKYEIETCAISQLNPIRYWDELTISQKISILYDIRHKGDCVWSIPYHYSEEMF